MSTLSAETLIRLWTEIGESVARAGVRKVVLFNSHGGQSRIIDIVARDLRVRHGMMMVVAYSRYVGGRRRVCSARTRSAMSFMPARSRPR